MADMFHLVDPEGDVIIVLRDPSKPFAVWDEDYSYETTPEPLDSVAGVSQEHDPLDTSSTICEPPTQISQEVFEVRFLVSSKHLIMASYFFKKNLPNEFWTRERTPEGHRIVPDEEWDCEAFLVLMYIIHGSFRSLPGSITLEMLAKIAVLVDYYECLEVVEPFAKSWIKHLTDTPGFLPTTCNRELLLWLTVALVFEQAELFKSATQIGLKESTRLLPTLGLPVHDVVDEIERQRRELIKRSSAKLNEVIELLRDGGTGCSFECDAIRLGSLIKQKHASKIPDPSNDPEFDYPGWSVAIMAKTICQFNSPQWTPSYKKKSFHSCDLSDLLDHKALDEAEGIELRLFRRNMI
ncbi:hypothetical protein F5Y16DRAFT_362860 [Xylariaceae sp. FL0255]|nr:hypothetical protein F5Y16DRAFT_362860 [Xylariaceae sp. FL0255]